MAETPEKFVMGEAPVIINVILNTDGTEVYTASGDHIDAAKLRRAADILLREARHKDSNG